jgi:hypothetical protein
LRQKFKEHVADGVLKRVFEETLGKYPVVLGNRVTYADLVRELGRALAVTRAEEVSPEDTVREAIVEAFQNQTPLGPTGFPGLRGETERFEAIVKRICNCE